MTHIIKTLRFAIYFMVILTGLSSCQAVEDVFGAGFYTGVFVVVFILIVIIIVIARINKK